MNHAAPAPDIRILGVGTQLPGDPVDNAALARQFGLDAAGEQWIDAFIGTRGRHFGFDLATGRRDWSLADLGAGAGARALRAAGVEPDEVDLLVMGTWSPDQLVPATVNVIADRLGVNDVPSYQLQSGCSGAVQALDLAHQLLQTGRHRTALVIGADTCAKHYRADMRTQGMEPAKLINALLFGDGAGAVVLSTRTPPGAPALRHVLVRLTGLGREPGQSTEWFGWGDERTEDVPILEDYKAIEQFVPKMAQETFEQLLRELDWAPEDADYLLPPQLSGRMTERIVAQLDVPHMRPISRVREIGNTGNSSPFFQIEQLLPMMMPGDRAVAVAIESSKWIKSGFAVEKV